MGTTTALRVDDVQQPSSYGRKQEVASHERRRSPSPEQL